MVFGLVSLGFHGILRLRLLCRVDRSVGSWVLLVLFCLLCVAHKVNLVHGQCMGRTSLHTPIPQDNCNLRAGLGT